MIRKYNTIIESCILYERLESHYYLNFKLDNVTLYQKQQMTNHC